MAQCSAQTAREWWSPPIVPLGTDHLSSLRSPFAFIHPPCSSKTCRTPQMTELRPACPPTAPENAKVDDFLLQLIRKNAGNKEELNRDIDRWHEGTLPVQEAGAGDWEQNTKKSSTVKKVGGLVWEWTRRGVLIGRARLPMCCC